MTYNAPGLISTSDQLNAAIQAFSAGGSLAAVDTNYVIQLDGSAGTIALTSALAQVDLMSGSTLTIEGNGDALDASGANRGLVLDSGALELDALTIENAVALGASGGVGQGGSAGAGGGLFLASGTQATLNDVTFANDAALGGAGGAGGEGDYAPGGGGGGGGLGGGLFVGSGAQASLNNVDFTNDTATGGAGQPTSVSGAVGDAPSIGIGQGGAGGGYASNFDSSTNGGFGGGGGGGGVEYIYTNVESGAAGGFGAGAGGNTLGGYSGLQNGGGGGGLGAGGDIFVADGGSVTVNGGSIGTGAATGGLGGLNAQNGQGLGGSVFVQGSGQLTVQPSAGQTIDFSGGVASDQGDGITVDGPGTVVLDNASGLDGDIDVAQGALQVTLDPAALGSGPITDDGTLLFQPPESGSASATVPDTWFDPNDVLTVDAFDGFGDDNQQSFTWPGDLVTLANDINAAYPGGDVSASSDGSTITLYNNTNSVLLSGGGFLSKLGIPSGYMQDYSVTGEAPQPMLQPTDAIDLNGVIVTVGGAGQLSDLVAAINAASIDGITASIDGNDLLQLVSPSANITLSDASGTPLETLGITPGAYGVTHVLSNSLSGSGQLVVDQSAADTFVVDGSVSLTGGVDLAAGSLVFAGPVSTLGGAIQDGGSILFQDMGANLLTGAITGAGSVTVDVDGSITFSGANTFSGGLDLQSGEAILQASGAAGAGDVSFGTGVAELTLTAAAMAGGTFANTLDNLGPTDQIDLQGLPFTPGESAVLNGDTLNVTSGAQTFNFTLSDPQVSAWVLTNDGAGGTLLTPDGPDTDVDTGADISANLSSLLNQAGLDFIIVDDNAPIVVTVAELLNASGMDRLGNADGAPLKLEVVDSGDAIAGNLSALDADIEIISITATSASVADFQALTGQPGVTPITAVEDTGANLSGAVLGELQAAGVTSVTVTDNSQVALSLAQFQADTSILSGLAFADGQTSAVVDIVDSADNVADRLAALSATPEIGSITVDADAFNANDLLQDSVQPLTLVISGGGAMVMNLADSGVAEVVLTGASQAYQFTADGEPGLSIVDQNSGADVIVVGDSSQSVAFQNAGATVQATAANAGALVQGAGSGDTLEITTGDDATLNWNDSDISVVLDQATDVTLSPGVNSVTGSSGDDTFVVSQANMTSGFSLDGGAGSNTLELSGGGTFDLTQPQLSNVQTVVAAESQDPSAQQTVVLPTGAGWTVEVTTPAIDPSNSNSPTVTLVGSDAADTVDLGGAGGQVVLDAAPGGAVVATRLPPSGPSVGEQLTIQATDFFGDNVSAAFTWDGSLGDLANAISSYFSGALVSIYTEVSGSQLLIYAPDGSPISYGGDLATALDASFAYTGPFSYPTETLSLPVMFSPSDAIDINGNVISVGGAGALSDLASSINSAAIGVTASIDANGYLHLASTTSHLDLSDASGAPLETLGIAPGLYAAGTTWGALSGAGEAVIEQLSTDTTVVSGAVTSTGGIDLTQGTLAFEGDLSGMGGALEDDGVVVFQETGSTTLSAPIAGAGSVIVDAGGAITLSGVSAFSGGIEIAAGELDLAANLAGGTGAIDFAPGADVTLGLAVGVQISNTLTGFAPGDAIDVAGLPAAFTQAVLMAGDVLWVGQSASDFVALQLGSDASDFTYGVASDGHGGARLTATAPGGASGPATASESYTAGGTPASLGVGALSFSGAVSAVVTISNGFLDGDRLAFAAVGGVTGAYDAANGVLTLAGDGSDADLLATLKSVTFSSSIADPTDAGADPSREISIGVFNGTQTVNLQNTDVSVAASASGAPTITTLVGQPLNGSTIDVKGTGEVGDTVTLYADGGTTAVGSGVVASNGAFDITTTATFADGTHSLTATQTNSANLTSTASSAFPVTVDPNAPSITTLVGQPVNGSTIEVKGTGEAGDAVTLYADGGTMTVGSGVVASNGSFDITTTATFADGTHSLTATETDAANLSSTASSAFPVSVDPNAPAITTLVGQPTNGSTVEVKGTGEAGETVTLYADGGTTAVGAGVAGSNGTFDITTTATFTDGAHSLMATQTDGASLASTASTVFPVSVDPNAPSITTLVGQPVNGSTIEVKGTGEAGETVTLYADGGKTAAGSGVVGSNGTFDITTTETFADGTHSLTATETDAASLTSTASAAFPVSVDPGKPSITTLVGQPENGSNIEVKGAGEVGETVTLYADGGTTAIGSGLVGSDGTFDITTTATFAGGAHVLTATQTDGDGLNSAASAGFDVEVFGPPSAANTWITASPATVAADGVQSVTLRLTVEDAAGDLLAGQAVRLSGEGAGDAFTPISGQTDAHGQFTAIVASTTAETESIVATVGSANVSVMVTFTAPPTVSTPVIGGTTAEGQVLTVSASANEGAAVAYRWFSSKDGYTTAIGTGSSYQVQPGDEGYTLEATATATNAEGQTSSASATTAAVAPSAPAITTLVGAPVNGSTIEVKGTGEAGDTVTLYADGGTMAVGTGVVGSNGMFDIVTTATFAGGSHTLTATETDAESLTSPASAGFAVSVASAQTLPTGVWTITGAGGSNTYDAVNGTLNAGDKLNAGPGSNTLALLGGGVFNLSLPTQLAGITLVDAEEGQQPSGTIASTYQTVYLRGGLNVTLDVLPNPAPNAANPNPEGITIHGAADSSVINLGNGTDVVYLGGSSETVDGGSGPDVFYMSSATDGATINGGSGSNTLNFTGGGTIAMGSQITGISTVYLDNPATGQTQPGYVFTLPSLHNLVVWGSNGNDTITVGDASQVVHTGMGTSTVITNAANAGAAVIGGNGGQTTLELVGGGTFALGASTANVTVELMQAETVALGAHAVAVAGSTGGDNVTATYSRLLAGDAINLAGSNTLTLQGAGTFTLSTPAALNGISTLDVQEGQSGAGAIASTFQAVYMRSGQSLVVNVAPAVVNASNPNVAGVNLYGSSDSDVFNLGSGQDVVYLGSGTETVNGGSGTAFVWATTADQGATINGGSGAMALELSGGGTFNLGSQVTGVAKIVLNNPAAGQTQPAYVLTAPSVHNLTIYGSNGSDTITVGDASQTVRTGTGVSTVIAGAANSGATILGGTGGQTTYELTGGGSFTLNKADSNLTVQLMQAETVALGAEAYHITGSTGGDTITAGAGILVAGDVFNLSGSNTLALQGAGTFNLTTPGTLGGVTTITDQEGPGAAYQSVYLRSGQSFTVNVASSTLAGSGVTIYGAKDSSVINLGAGADTVYLGSSTETVNGGSGTDVYYMTAATAGATITGGSGSNTLNFTGGGTITMGSGITGVSTVDLDNPTSGQTQPAYAFAASGLQGLVVWGSNGNDTITVGDASQTIHTGAGTSTVISNAANSGAAVIGGTGGQTTYELAGGGDFTLNNSTANVTVELMQAETVALGSRGLLIEGSTGGDVITAVQGRLVAGDVFALAGSNTLALKGAGTFNLATPSSLGGITTIDVQEGQSGWGSIASTFQAVYMRSGQNLVVNVAAATQNPANPNVAGVNLYGANDSDVFNLGAGNDVVYLGSSGETVNGGSGTGFVWETAALQGATVKGGSGTVVLELEGGGTFVLGANDTNVGQVRLTGSTSAYDVTGDGQSGELINDQSSGADTLRAGAAGQTLTGGAAGMLTMEGFGSGVTTYKDSVTALNGDTIENYSANDRIDLTGLAYSKSVTVSYAASTSSSGTLNVYSGATLEASVHLFGQLAASSFSAQSDGSGGTVILDPPVQPPPALAVGH